MTEKKGSEPSELLVSDSQSADTSEPKTSQTSKSGSTAKKSKSSSTRAAPAKKTTADKNGEPVKKASSRRTSSSQKTAETDAAASEAPQPTAKTSQSRKKEHAASTSSSKQSGTRKTARSKDADKTSSPSELPDPLQPEQPGSQFSNTIDMHSQGASRQDDGPVSLPAVADAAPEQSAGDGKDEGEAVGSSSGAGTAKKSSVKTSAVKSGSSTKKTATKTSRTSRKKTEESVSSAPMPEAQAAPEEMQTNREDEQGSAVHAKDALPAADVDAPVSTEPTSAPQEKVKSSSERKKTGAAASRGSSRKKTSAGDAGTTEKKDSRSKKAAKEDSALAESVAALPEESPRREETADVKASPSELSVSAGGAGVDAGLQDKGKGESKGRSRRASATAKNKSGGRGEESVTSEQIPVVAGQPASEQGAPPEEDSSLLSSKADAPDGQDAMAAVSGHAGSELASEFGEQKTVETVETAGEDSLPVSSWSEFPSGFFDSSPEDFFESLDDDDTDEASASGGGTSEKKRRSRGRRGRGRKKAAAQQTTGSDAAEAPEQEFPVEAEKDDTDDEFVVVEGFTDDEPEALPAKGKTQPDDDDNEEVALKNIRRKMFVSVLPEEQVEVVLTEEGQVLEYYVEMLQQAKTKGNIYKGVIHNVDPNLQAAFVSYGAVKNGFLQIDEVHPEYYVTAYEADKGRKYPPIQKVLKAGQEVLVQVVKEPAGTKGAFLTTYLSMPGRFLVLTPGREQIGVSRKVENEKERARLRELLEGLSPGPGLGVIVRTVSMGASKTNLQRDLQYLKRTWKEVRTRGTTEKAPCLVYQEKDLTSRAVRDYLTENVGEIWVDDEQTASEVTDIAEALFPRKNNFVRVHKDTGTSLFERFNLQRQLDQIHSREVSLPSGGRLVIDATEALTAIDINSGRSGGKSNFEDMAFRTNMEAAKMIPLQLRLRDIGGQIVADFIEMRDKNHWREVEKALRNGMKVDRARYDVGKIGPFGMMEIVRQRLGSSAISISTEPCPCCNGTGTRRNMEWQSQSALREILRSMRAAQAQKQEKVCYKTEADLALHLLNHKKQRLQEMEQTHGVQLEIQIGVQDKS